MIPYGTIRTWTLNPNLDKRVRIVGLANTDLPMIGASYIIDLMGLRIPGYDYTHCIAFAIHLQ